MKDKSTKLIKFLIEAKEDMSIMAIAKAVKMDYKNVFLIVKRLEKQGVITIRKFGASNIVQLKKSVHPLMFEAEYERRKEILRNKNILVMLNRIKESMKSSMYVLLLFGSYAKRTHTEKSDIDLMFIVPDTREQYMESKINDVVKMTPLPMHHFIFTESQFLDMAEAKGFNVGKEAVKTNVILHGIETYYEMMK